MTATSQTDPLPPAAGLVYGNAPKIDLSGFGGRSPSWEQIQENLSSVGRSSIFGGPKDMTATALALALSAPAAHGCSCARETLAEQSARAVLVVEVEALAHWQGERRTRTPGHAPE